METKTEDFNELAELMAWAKSLPVPPPDWRDIQDFNIPLQDDGLVVLLGDSEGAEFVEIVKKLRSLAKIKFDTFLDLLHAQMEVIDKTFGTSEDGDALHALDVLVRLDNIGAINTPEALQMLKVLETLGKLEVTGAIKSYPCGKVTVDEIFAFRYRSIFEDLRYRSYQTKALRTKKRLSAALGFAELILEAPLDVVVMQKIYIANGREGGLISGQSRADKANKSEVVSAWHAWQNDPKREPYGNKRGSKARFDEDMIKRFSVNPETVRKWSAELQKAAKLTA